MKKRTNMKSILAVAAALILGFSTLAACGTNAPMKETPAPQTEAQRSEAESTLAKKETEGLEGGVLFLKVNPEIAIAYDADGLVTGVTGRNDDGTALLKEFTGYEGKACKDIVVQLVNEIAAAGYFVDDVDGNARQITIEIEKGSMLPTQNFLDEIEREVREELNENKWENRLNVGESPSYGRTDYDATDYDPQGTTDYMDTDYGPNNDGVTDYDDTDYGPNNDGVTDYGRTDYGKTDYNDGKTDYGRTDYDDGTTDYNDSDYGR